MTRDEFLARVAARKSEITSKDIILADIRSRADALGSTPTLAKLISFLSAIRDVIKDIGGTL